MKVCMKSTDEVEKLQERLTEAAKEYVAEKETTIQPEKAQVIKRVLSQMTVRFEKGRRARKRSERMRERGADA